MSPKAKKEMIDQLTGKDIERDKVNQLIRELKELDKGINGHQTQNERITQILRGENNNGIQCTELLDSDPTLGKNSSFITKIKPPEVILQGKVSRIHDEITPLDLKKQLAKDKKESGHSYSYPGILNPQQNNGSGAASVAVNNSMPQKKSAGVQKQKVIRAHL